MQENLYSDLDLSFIPNPKTGDLVPKTNVTAIQRAANHIVRLEKLDIPFAPHLRSGLKSYLFANVTRIESANIKKDIQTALKHLEPRVSVKKVDVDSSNPKTMIITVTYACESLNTEGSFNLTIERIR